MKDVLIKRLFLLTKLIFKPMVMFGGYTLYAMAVANEHRIYGDIGTTSIFKSLLFIDKLIPFETVFNAIKDNIIHFEHSRLEDTVLLFTVIPFIPMLLRGFFKGLGGLFSACAPYFFVDYVYRDTGAYAETRLGEGFFLFAFAIILRLALAYVFYTLSPALLVISWVWNLIQFIFVWPGRGKKEAVAGEV